MISARQGSLVIIFSQYVVHVVHAIYSPWIKISRNWKMAF